MTTFLRYVFEVKWTKIFSPHTYQKLQISSLPEPIKYSLYLSPDAWGT